jgi:hypothetical protein
MIGSEKNDRTERMQQRIIKTPITASSFLVETRFLLTNVATMPHAITINIVNTI